MSAWEFRRIQATASMSLPVIIREINERLRFGSVAYNDQRRKAALVTPLRITADGTYVAFIAPEDMELTGVTLLTSSGTCSVSLEIDAVGVTMVGGSPITATTTATETDASSPEPLASLAVVTVIVTGISGNTLTVVPQVRRA